MNHLIENFQRKRRIVSYNEGKESLKKPKTVTPYQPEKTSLKCDINPEVQGDNTKNCSKNFFQSYYNSHKAQEDKIMLDSSTNTNSKKALYDKYLREMNNYRYVVSNSNGMNISPCCRFEN